MRVVPLALKEYFLYNIPLMDTIQNSNDIYDFCLRLKTNSKSTPYFQYINKETGEVETIKLDRTTRYYISNSGGILYKDFSHSISGVNVGYSVTLFNTYEDRDDYDINYKFYLREANKIKDVIEDKQLSLFSDFDFQ